MIKFKIDIDHGRYYVEIRGHASGDSEEFNACCGMVSVLAQSCAAACNIYGDGFQLIESKTGHLKFKVNHDNVSEAILYALASGLVNVANQFPSELENENKEQP